MSAHFHIGTFFLFVAMILLVVASISAPTVSSINFLSVTALNGSTVNFGSLGFCVSMEEGNSCSPTAVAYRIADEIAALGFEPFSSVKAASLHGLTGSFVLHPIAAGISALAFLMAVCSHRIGYLFAALVAFVAFAIALVVLIIDFVVFGFVKSHVNDGNNDNAAYGTAIWLVLAATIILFFGSITTCFACFHTHRRKSRS
ncbi:hypothetical protein C8R43DRAFT_1106776 [Mycena crocata]|nr:hypothetical protein C8R43DRAFT_1106776 [Mycena crocata]